ncbi:MAG: hypothetical protein AAB408_01320 [Patescibacteria group bacterium]
MSENLAVASPSEASTELFHIIEAMVISVVRPMALARDPKRTGGWFTLWRKTPWNVADTEAVPVVGFPIGVVSAERFLTYIHFANEKAARLSVHPEHVSSWQSRDERDTDRMKHKYGGAIRCYNGLFFSFSGFSELEDEMICTLAALELGVIGRDDIMMIIASSGNEPLAKHLRSLVAGTGA